MWKLSTMSPNGKACQLCFSIEEVSAEVSNLKSWARFWVHSFFISNRYPHPPHWFSLLSLSLAQVIKARVMVTWKWKTLRPRRYIWSDTQNNLLGVHVIVQTEDLKINTKWVALRICLNGNHFRLLHSFHTKLTLSSSYVCITAAFPGHMHFAKYVTWKLSSVTTALKNKYYNYLPFIDQGNEA
jgi:hypothetical protein